MKDKTPPSAPADKDRESPARAALLAAATALFAERGPAAVSLREIAARAGVNYGLVHRHFGTKEALIRAVAEPLTQSMADIAATSLEVGPEAAFARLFSPSSPENAYWRMLARAMLDGQDPRQLQSSFPVADLLRQRLSEGAPALGIAPFQDPDAATAVIMAFALGLMVFERFLYSATDLDRDDPLQARARVIRAALEVAIGRKV